MTIYTDGRTEGEYYLSNAPDVLIPFVPVWTETENGGILQELQPDAVKVMYDQCAYGL
jgi:hypothetical protein